MDTSRRVSIIAPVLVPVAVVYLYLVARVEIRPIVAYTMSNVCLFKDNAQL